MAAQRADRRTVFPVTSGATRMYKMYKSRLYTKTSFYDRFSVQASPGNGEKAPFSRDLNTISPVHHRNYVQARLVQSGRTKDGVPVRTLAGFIFPLFNTRKTVADLLPFHWDSEKNYAAPKDDSSPEAFREIVKKRTNGG